MTILKGWKFERTSIAGLSMFEPITITTPNGFSTVVYKHERNPANILWMLADNLMKNGWKLVPVEPTQEMIDAAEKAEARHVIEDRKRGGYDPQLSFRAVYAVMVKDA